MNLHSGVTDPSDRDIPADPAEIWRSAIVVTLRDAATQLAGSIDSEPRVHALRRGAKQLRALVLLAPAAFRDLAQEARDHADALRRSLGHTRDAAVRRETFARLMRGLEDDATRLAPALEAAPDSVDSPSPPATLREELAALAERWSRCDLRDLRIETLAETLGTTYRRARKRRKAALDGHTHDIHRWRRAIVDLDLQTGIFERSSPRLAQVSKQAHELRDLLGRMNDIDALSAFLAGAAGLDAAALASLGAAAEDERQALFRKADRCAQRLLKLKPDVWKDDVSALLYAAARTADAAAPAKVQQANVWT